MTSVLRSRFARRRLAALALGPALGLAGCAVGPDYARPSLPVAHAWVEDAAASAPGGRIFVDAELPQAWWELYRSDALDALVRASLANNPSVAAAQASLKLAQENVRAQQAAYYPSVDAGYSATRQKVAGTLASPASSNAYLYNLHTAQLEVSYLPDVFGANRRQVESLQAQADAQRWAIEATYLTLSSNLVVAVVGDAALQVQIDAGRELVEVQRDIVARYRRLLAIGQVALLDLTAQEAALATLEANLPVLDKQRALSRDQIKALLGELPEQPLAPIRLEALSLPEPLPLTLPSSLVEHRPDVLAAEAQLRSASASIGVARAARLPSVSLGVDAWGSSAYTLSRLFSSGTGFWTLAGGVTQPVFDAGALEHREGAARAAYDQSVATYRSTVINAYQNVADALQAVRADADALRIAEAARSAAQRSLDITRRQFDLGDVGAIAVLLARQNELQARVAVAQARAARLTDAALLFQALGGGWWNRADATASARP